MPHDSCGEIDDAHPDCRPSPDEELAIAVASALTALDFERVCERSTPGPKPDYRTISSARERASIEVKQLTSAAVRRHNAQRAQYLGPEPFHAVPSLTRTWLVFIDTSNGHAAFGSDNRTPVLKTLLRDLTTELKRLERDHATQNEVNGGHDPAIRRLTHSWVCSSIPDSPFEPGIFFTDSHGTLRTRDLETDVVRFLSEWLDSGLAANLRLSLRAESGRRIAVLLADSDGPAEGMIRTLQEGAAVPVTSLPLPAEIDAVILIAGSHVLHYDGINGWRRHTIDARCPPRSAGHLTGRGYERRSRREPPCLLDREHDG
ncbi:hypothetical protein CH299_12030 [Rhodococcus sp. 14-2686-1-2]|nr:hypothetical protein CH301_11480 [Rhodococcus sp. 15-1189-1-1a]OZF15517.1 hypothetical protein CH299_12030 [Rhodococcus sp. 14-2686-1-2]